MLHGGILSLAYLIAHSIKSTLMTIYFVRLAKFRLGFSLNLTIGKKILKPSWCMHTHAHSYIRQVYDPFKGWYLFFLLYLCKVLLYINLYICVYLLQACLFLSCVRFLLFLPLLHCSASFPSFLLPVKDEEMWWNVILGYVNFGFVK